MSRDLLLACVLSTALATALAAVLERAWTIHNAHMIELKRTIEGMD